MGQLKHFPRVAKSNFERVLVLILIALVGVLYSPVFSAYFNADDFNFLSFLRLNIRELLNGQQWDEWFIGGIVNYSVFRPMGNLFWLLNYVTFGLEPFGYHFVTVIFHLIASSAVFILSRLLTRNRITAGIAAILFAMMPVHAEAVSWVAANYDVLSEMYYFVGLIFYILYRQRTTLLFYLVALAAFVLGLSSKETALTFPFMLIIYDLVYYPRDWTRAVRVLAGYVPFWIVFAIRFIRFGHGYYGLVFAPESWWYYVDFNLLRVFNPLPETQGEIRWIALACTVLLLLAYRFRAAMFFSLIWIPVTLFPTTVGGVTDRSFYIPSFGVSLLLAIVLASLLTHQAALVRAAGLFVLLLLIVIYATTLYSRNQGFVRASQVAQAILQRVAELHPTVPSDGRLVFVGVPKSIPEGQPVFGVGLVDAMRILYRDPSFQVFNYSKFPIWLDNLEHTYFFTVDHRRVNERPDLIATLESRKRCSKLSRVAVLWDLASDLHGWEPWNELDGFENRDEALVTHSVGSDPFMGSPMIDIPALAIGDIEITMRVRARQPTFEGEVYWLASEQQDFYPALKQSFIGLADGEFHTYRVDIAKSGNLFLDDRIARLRLDPVNMPAEIAFKSIQVNTHCELPGTGECVCVR